jgi:hypothetical protein
MTQPVAVRLDFLALGLIVLGVVLGFRSELLGGLVSLAGYILFLGTEIVRHHAVTQVVLSTIGLLGLPGLLYTISGILKFCSPTLTCTHPN